MEGYSFRDLVYFSHWRINFLNFLEFLLGLRIKSYWSYYLRLIVSSIRIYWEIVSHSLLIRIWLSIKFTNYHSMGLRIWRVKIYLCINTILLLWEFRIHNSCPWIGRCILAIVLILLMTWAFFSHSWLTFCLRLLKRTRSHWGGTSLIKLRNCFLRFFNTFPPIEIWTFSFFRLSFSQVLLQEIIIILNFIWRMHLRGDFTFAIRLLEVQFEAELVCNSSL